MKRAFTLVELLIVITIIGILVVALLPRLTGGRDKARDAARLSHLFQISTGIENIANDYLEGTYPRGENNGALCIQREDVEEVMSNYLSTLPKEPLLNNKWSGSTCNGGTASMDVFGDPASIPLPNEGYDYIPTLNGFLMVAKLENNNTTGEFIYDEASLATELATNDPITQSTQDILSALTPCENTNDCSSTIFVVPR